MPSFPLSWTSMTATSGSTASAKLVASSTSSTVPTHVSSPAASMAIANDWANTG